MNTIDRLFTTAPAEFAGAYINNVQSVLERSDRAEIGRFIQTLLEARGRGAKGDVLVGISVSRNSPNVIKAFEFARSAGIKTVALTASDGGKMKAMADEVIHVPTEAREYGPAEDAHLVLNHLAGAYLMRFVRAV
jgi:DNA-binding MurR/RpiR family transcriptional regulator